MRKSDRSFRRSVAVLNWIGIGLVVAGCANYFLGAHHYTQSQYYLIAAVACLAIAAVLARQRREVTGDNGAPGDKAVANNAPPWMYLYVVFCLVLGVLNVDTNAFRSPTLTIATMAVVGIGIGKIIIDRYRDLTANGTGFSRVQCWDLFLARVCWY